MAKIGAFGDKNFKSLTNDQKWMKKTKQLDQVGMADNHIA